MVHKDEKIFNKILTTHVRKHTEKPHTMSKSVSEAHCSNRKRNQDRLTKAENNDTVFNKRGIRGMLLNMMRTRY